MKGLYTLGFLILVILVSGCVTKEWFTYTNSNYKFSIEYPQNFLVNELRESSDIQHVVTFSEPMEKTKIMESLAHDSIRVTVRVWDNPSNISLREWFDKRDWAKLENETIGEIRIGEGKGLKIVNTNFNTVNVEVLLSKEEKVYSILGSVQVKDETKEENLEIINQIINSFRFTEPIGEEYSNLTEEISLPRLIKSIKIGEETEVPYELAEKIAIYNCNERIKDENKCAQYAYMIYHGFDERPEYYVFIFTSNDNLLDEDYLLNRFEYHLNTSEYHTAYIGANYDHPPIVSNYDSIAVHFDNILFEKAKQELQSSRIKIERYYGGFFFTGIVKYQDLETGKVIYLGHGHGLQNQVYSEEEFQEFIKDYKREEISPERRQNINKKWDKAKEIVAWQGS